MAKKETPPKWQKGSHEFEVTLPAEKTKNGKEEKVKLAFRWKVRATKPMTARGWTRWEMAHACGCLDRAARALDTGQSFTDFQAHDLASAFAHAVRAWCRTHLRGEGTSDGANHYAFMDKAPDDLKRLASDARLALYRLERGGASPAEAVATTRAVVGALLEAASHPPRNRRRFPARLRSGRPVRKPRVRPGSWIDTGRYRLAQVLEMMPDPPHIMMLSYGDEIDHDFRPHIVHWKAARKPKRIPSLKDAFSAGAWIRHARFGYGRVAAVHDSTMDVDFRSRRTTLVPDPRLSKIERVTEPEPEDTRPLAKRFPPGTWVSHDGFGQGVVLGVKGDTLTMLGPDRVVRLIARDDAPVIWKLDRTPLDLTLPRERRRMWWWQNDDARRGHRPCPCCGYPNLAAGDEYGLEPEQCIVCGWTDEWDGEEDAGEVRPVPDPDDPLDWEQPNWGYSLTEARRNFEERRVMFRVGDKRGASFERTADLRRLLMARLDKIVGDASAVHEDDWQIVERIRCEVLDKLH